MGQKVSPKGFRLAVRKKWDSYWIANKKEFGDFLQKDLKMREFLKKHPACSGASKFVIKRMSGKMEVIIHTSRPGLVIGKKGSEIELLKEKLKELTKQDISIEIEEIKRPDMDAVLVAQQIKKQIERRMPFRRVLKKAIRTTKDAGAKGIKIKISGRLGGAEIARSEEYKEGKIPLHTLRADIDYATDTAFTTYGAIGIKVWINKGEK